jgi:hypothetical protein
MQAFIFKIELTTGRKRGGACHKWTVVWASESKWLGVNASVKRERAHVCAAVLESRCSDGMFLVCKALEHTHAGFSWKVIGRLLYTNVEAQRLSRDVRAHTYSFESSTTTPMISRSVAAWCVWRKSRGCIIVRTQGKNEPGILVRPI